jgi:hypothetical protein
LKGTVEQIKVSKMITSESEVEISFFKNTKSFYEHVDNIKAGKTETNMAHVITKQRENTELIREIEMQLKELIKRSDSFT